MKTNKEILNEAFFKKESYADKVQKKMPQYAPVDPKDPSKSLGGQLNVDHSIFAVKDADEMKKRLTGTFGAAFGDNNIKSMASKALKTFPIIVSDNVEPETVMSLKKMMEEQYADYIQLLISNQVIDLSAYGTADGENGSTIAIQALDKLSGADFSSNRLANKAANTGKLDADDYFGNIPLFNILRESHMDLHSGDELYDSILENAIVVPSEHVAQLIEYINSNSDEISEFLTEALPGDPFGRRVSKEDPSNRSLTDVLKDYGSTESFTNYAKSKQAVLDKEETVDHLRGLVDIDDKGREVYNKLSNAEIVINKNHFDAALNRSIGEFLLEPKNLPIKERFEKACMLLQCELIAGSEFIDYCTIRLGIPMSKDTRATICSNFRFNKVKAYNRTGDHKDNIFIRGRQLKALKKNEKIMGKILPRILKVKLADVVKTTVSATGVGAISGGSALGVGALIVGAVSNPVILAAVLAAATGASAYLIAKLVKRLKIKKHFGKVEGWERVENLIDAMDRQREEVIERYKKPTNLVIPEETFKSTEKRVENDANKAIAAWEKGFKNEEVDIPDDEAATAKEINDNLRSIDKFFGRVDLHESLEYNNTLSFNTDPDYLRYVAETFVEVYDECMLEEDFRNEMLAEGVLTSIRAKALERKLAKDGTAMKMTTKYVNKKPGKDLLIAPEFSARSNYAYGETEIDQKLVKDRKYNQPLLVTIRFKERYSDGKFSDNELTAVIGILGKVIRIPSEEMKYILTSNAEGETLKGIFKSGNLKNAVSDILSIKKIDKKVEGLPTSVDVWENLEKVRDLIVSNKLAGKKTNNVANAHIVFSEKEIDEVRVENGVDYKRDMKVVSNLMKRYSAFCIMIADDPAQRLYSYNGIDSISWDIVPYKEILSKDTGDQLTSALAKLGSIGLR